jgi:uncharacterized RDD family membrane protein YckC
MDDKYYILEEGEQTGPFTLEELIDAAPDVHTRVLSTAENTWMDACDLPELYDYFRGLGIYFPTENNLASPLIRLGAFVIDMVFIYFIFTITLLILSSRGVLPGVQTLAQMGALSKLAPQQLMTMEIAVYLILITYFTVGEASAMQASIGKRICGLVVVNADGEGISFPVALARSLAKVVSISFWGIGFISIFWTEHRQTLPDYLAKTYVIKKDA